jgi:CheY-like chemotaxis protein
VDLLSFVRNGPDAPLPFVMMSGAFTRAELFGLAEKGADAVLLKPFRVEVLFNEVQQAIERRAIRP